MADSICERVNKGPYDRDLVDGTLVCSDNWGNVSADGQGSPCRMLRGKQKQKLTAIPLQYQFSGSTYVEGGVEKPLADLLGNVYMAPLIDPYKSAQKNLSIQDAIRLNEAPDTVARCRDQSGQFMTIALQGHADCPPAAQKQLLNCARNGMTDACLSDTMGQEAMICAGKIRAECVGPTCAWAGKCSDEQYKTETSCTGNGALWSELKVLDENENLVTKGCVPATAAATCYNVLQERQQCTDDAFLRQYVADVRNGKLAERREAQAKLYEKGCKVDYEPSGSAYIRLRTRAPHGIVDNGTKVLIKGIGNDGLRSVFVVDDFTLTYLRQEGDEEIPRVARDARLYVPYESSEGMVGYTRGKEGRPAKSDAACVRRESRDQCDNMLVAFKRKYTLIPHKCKKWASVCISSDNRQGTAMWDDPTECFFTDAASTKDFTEKTCGVGRRCPSTAECVDGRCRFRQKKRLPCGYKKVNAGLGPDPEHGVYHNTTAEVLKSPQNLKNDLCMAKAGSEELSMESDASVQACAEACAKHLNCTYFAFSNSTGECLLQSMDTDDCATGWQGDNTYDTYELRTATNLVGCSRFGSTCCPESHARGAGNENVTCGVQMPTEDGAYQLMLGQKYKAAGRWSFRMPPDNEAPRYCIPEQVEVLKQVDTVRQNAKNAADTFADMQDKNSQISKLFEAEKMKAADLEAGCCDDEGNCGCPYVTNYPVYLPGYHDEVLRSTDSDPSKDRPKPMPVGIPFSLAGCDSWTDIESLSAKNKDNDLVDQLIDVDDEEDDAEEQLSLQDACEHGWKRRDCESFELGDLEDALLMEKSDERMRLSACRSGIKLRSINAPLNYKQASMVRRAATFERRKVIGGLTTACNPDAEPTSETFCSAAGTEGAENPQNACVDDGRGTNRCQHCTKDSECALQMGSEEFVCRPYLDMSREIIYDNMLESNPSLQHAYKFNTCQRVDMYNRNFAKLDRMPFAENQRHAKMQMEIAKGRARQTTTVMMSVLAAAVLGVAIYLILRKLKIV